MGGRVGGGGDGGGKVAAAYRVVPIQGKGMGALATRAIGLGERILAEAPLTLQGPGLPALEETVRALPPDKREQFFELSHAATLYGRQKTVAGIAATNGIPFRVAGKLFGGVFFAASRFNHSCDAVRARRSRRTKSMPHSHAPAAHSLPASHPIRLLPPQNCAFKWNHDLRQLTVHCCKPGIAAGHELTFNYGFGAIFAPRETRRQHLQRNFGFECMCAKCALRGSALAASESRIDLIGEDTAIIRELAQFGSQQAVLDNEPSAVLTRLEQRYRLMTMEEGGTGGVYHGIEGILQAFVELCDYAATALVMMGSHSKELARHAAVNAKAAAYRAAARRWAEAARQAVRMLAGDDSPAYRAWSAAIESGCWDDDGAKRAAAPRFIELWLREGLNPSPLCVVEAPQQSHLWQMPPV